MKIVVTIETRDGKFSSYECVDVPTVGDWVTVYLPSLKRKIIPRDAIACIEIDVQ